jgi:hypothetical protein
MTRFCYGCGELLNEQEFIKENEIVHHYHNQIGSRRCYFR